MLGLPALSAIKITAMKKDEDLRNKAKDAYKNITDFISLHGKLENSIQFLNDSKSQLEWHLKVDQESDDTQDFLEYARDGIELMASMDVGSYTVQGASAGSAYFNSGSLDTTVALKISTNDHQELIDLWYNRQPLNGQASDLMTTILGAPKADILDYEAKKALEDAIKEFELWLSGNSSNYDLCYHLRTFYDLLKGCLTAHKGLKARWKKGQKVPIPWKDIADAYCSDNKSNYKSFMNEAGRHERLHSELTVLMKRSYDGRDWSKSDIEKLVIDFFTHVKVIISLSLY